MTDHYKARREYIRGYAEDVRSHAPPFQRSGDHIRTGCIEPEAFTANGERIAQAYEGIVADYSWTAWRIGMTLDRVAEALDDVAKKYGKAEARAKDAIGTVGKQL
ncbi:hypothetical protein [Actinomadura opuntiae]|uniref:hypothetical protein n=1 Tax=Actinomadura sp. OS1-43 TaxID=604315 RepID=UPI00255B33C9|nr:hypothetical protein [Actinomadura sp. OS1-43]MDL4820773.1 hypothetical protein [Actinomadura sp. OS1-43]